MKIISATLVRSYASPGEGFIRDGLPEAAFMGRSNVGKSSLINGLLRRKNMTPRKEPAPVEPSADAE